ncbi:uncharacterized protein LOC108141563 [Drosophila elegans]|uniref:uncharacterized protein LOC108141563 n=1 Tax=Drosophila elegans TaxID=30023 RepID=UPI0007E6CD3E|nr:uncharacterized protein LOC108141563 [Drosophila elegans]
MPVDQVVISYIRHRNWMNVLLLRSMNLYKEVLGEGPTEKIEVSPNGICWSEQNLEYRIMVDKFFDIQVKTEQDEPPYSLVEVQNNNLAFGLGLRRIRHRMVEQLTVDVEQANLIQRIEPLTPYSFHCSNCANELIERRQYLQVKEVPLSTMKPQNYFCARYRTPVYPKEDELFFGLNYLVISIQLLGNGVTSTQGRRRLECSRCKQSVGEFLGKDVAVQLYADAIRLVAGDSPVFEFKEIFGHVTATQMMLRLLHDADPTNPEKTRLFLKAVRPDGQLHYLLLQVDTREMHILRSELDTSEEAGHLESAKALPMEADTSSESDFEMSISDVSSSSISTITSSPQTGIEERSLSKPKTAEGIAPKSVRYVELRGYRGCRVKFLFSGTDHDLTENNEIFTAWRNDGCHMLRISYAMMAELIGELHANENLVAVLEMIPPPSKSDKPRLSYIIYEKDEEFYARQQKFTKRST